MKKKLNFILLFLFVGIGVLKAQCDPIVWYQTEDKRIYTANLSTGVSTTVCSAIQSPSSGDPLTDIAFAPDGKLYGVCYRSADSNRLYLINTGNCTTTTLTRTGGVGQAGTRTNSLTFLPDGTALVGYNDSNKIQRITITGTNSYTLQDWWSPPAAANILGSGGDFILLGDVLYASMFGSSNNVVYAISVEEDTFNPISMIGEYIKATAPEGLMFGMAAVYGKLYGGFVDKTIRELTLSGTTLSYSNNLLNGPASDDVFGMTSQGESLGQANPTITSNPASGIICPGGEVILRSSVSSGNQWYRNGIAIPGATQRRYFASLPGNYTVRVTYAAGCFTEFSNTITLTASTFAISTQPANANYCQSSTATATALSVASTGGNGAGPTYQWYSNTANNNSTGTLISGATSATYNPPITASGTVYYYAIVKRGPCELASNTARIVVTAKPTKPVVANGSTLANTCPVATVNLTTLQPANVSGQTYEWHTVATNPTAGTLVNNPNAVTSSGNYYLYAVSTVGGCFSDASNPVAVTITPCPTCTDPVIDTQPVAATYCQNKTATALSVTATGASLSYQWYRNTTNSITGATPVGGDLPTYTPIITATGILYYYVVITSGTCSTRSNFVAVNVNPTPAAPVASAATLINPCPITTADLTTLEPAAVTGISYEWHTVATNPTTGTKVANPSAVSVSGIYYLYSKADTGGCFSNASSAVTVTITSCTTCTSSGVTSVNLNSLYTGTLPTGVVLEWWTSPTRDLPPTPGTKVLDPLNVTVSGTYYVFFYDTINLCYNTDNSASAVTVNILPPCATCTNPGSTAVGGSPTKVGITVQKKQETWPESIKNGFIALQSQNKGMVITRVARVGGGTGGAPNLTTDSIKDPKEGMLVYDLAADCVKLFNGTIWKCLAKDCL